MTKAKSKAREQKYSATTTRRPDQRSRHQQGPTLPEHANASTHAESKYVQSRQSTNPELDRRVWSSCQSERLQVTILRRSRCAEHIEPLNSGLGNPEFALIVARDPEPFAA